jgi:ribosome assembly protein 4
MIYTGSHDKAVRIWDADKGVLLHTLALRTAYFDHEPVPDSDEGKRAKAKARFEKAVKVQGKVAERVVSASDDFTMYLWDPSSGTKPVARLHGHQKQVNHVTFSPDGLLIASAGWDNHTKIWSAK